MHNKPSPPMRISYRISHLWLMLVMSALLTVGKGDQEFSPATVRIHHERSTESKIFATVEAFQETHNLILQKVKIPSVRIQELILGPNGTIESVNVSSKAEKHHFFSDENTGSLFYLTGEGNLEGALTDFVGLRFQNNSYIASKSGGPSGKFCATSSAEIPQEDIYSTDSPISDTRQNPSYVVELTVYADSVLLNRFSSVSALDSYLRVYWYLVNRRFKTVQGATINLKLTDIRVSTSVTVDSYFMHAPSTSSSHIRNSLTLFGKYVGSQVSSGKINRFDAAQLMSGRDFYDVENGVVKKNFAGLAYVGSVCMISSGIASNTGVAEDNGYYYGVLNSAHEMGHTLGAPHDGDGTSAKCPWSAGYLMSYIANSYLSLRFSQCSSDAMKAIYFKEFATCLKSNTNPTYYPFNQILPGQSITLDKQCQYYMGQSGAYADKSVPAKTHCYSLRCRWGSTIKTFQFPALEGTPCYSGGRCLDGYCQ
ncbi:venom metalloproteinase antarease-like TtrivMP_A [Hyalella azteca]|uniref:Venom metalloproteinase antarease-like TtrivMP_A n=1 Tax=Hyalella azteca TaxID=294128 RepID=A0A8B7PB50_HYAAZ|nr:venom metalloproteinase antarease-like TtrivMP_A [Hyalella azteca]